MGISIKTSGESGRLRIAVAGEVDVSNADELREAADKALATNPASLEVDLAEVPYIDSTGIGVLVGAAHRAADAKAELHVTNPQRNVSRVFRMLGVESELGLTD